MPQLLKTSLGVQLYRLSCEAVTGHQSWTVEMHLGLLDLHACARKSACK
jgi:hypothetical protein